MKKYLNELVAWIGSRWNEYWFAPLAGDRLARVRPLVCVVAAVWLLVSMTGSDWWFGEAGWSASTLARQLTVASEGTWSARFHLSPLWSSSDPIVFRIWAGCSLVLSIVAALGLGGRAVMLSLFLAVLFLAQRLTWTTDGLEPFLIALLAYLSIDPGRALLQRAPAAASAPRWTLTLATRLIQVHVWLLIAGAFASQLSSLPWWRGDAVWWLAVTNHSHFLTPDMLRGHILQINALTHAIVIGTGLAVMALWSPMLRPIGVICGCGLGLAYAILGDQTLYGLLLIAGLLSFWPTAEVDPKDPGRAL